MSEQWKVFALRAGCSEIDHSMATYLERIGEPLVIPHTMFALVRGSETAVVDTSFQSAEAVNAAYPQKIWRDQREHPLELLKELGVRSDSVGLVVCTHLHYDHRGCNALFANARVLVQRRELEYALNPTAKVMEREFFSPKGGFSPPFDPRRLELLDGDARIAPGLSLRTLPGYTPGSQGEVVETRDGAVGLAGDLVMVQENFDAEQPVGLHTSVDAWYESLAKLKGRVDRVVPSHDMRVFTADEPIAEIA